MMNCRSFYPWEPVRPEFCSLAERRCKPLFLLLHHMGEIIWPALMRSSSGRQILPILRSAAYPLVLLFPLSGALVAAPNTLDEHVTGRYELRGDSLTARFQVANGSIKATEVEDLTSRAKLRPGELFSLLLRDGHVIAASQLKMDATPEEEAVSPNPLASRQAEQIAGRKLCADLSAKDNSFAVHWCAVVRDGTNYLRQEVTFGPWRNLWMLPRCGCSTSRLPARVWRGRLQVRRLWRVTSSSASNFRCRQVR